MAIEAVATAEMVIVGTQTAVATEASANWEYKIPVLSIVEMRIEVPAAATDDREILEDVLA